MASETYGYNNKVADVIRPMGQGKVKKTLDGFRSVDNVDIEHSSIQTRLNSRNVSNGSFMGTQQVRGQLQVVDSNGKAVMIMGYKPGAF
jgi:hypothetical protein